MKIKIGIKIIWSNNRLLPKSENILIKGYDGYYSHNGRIGMSNSYKNYTYRFYPYITVTIKH